MGEFGMGLSGDQGSLHVGWVGGESRPRGDGGCARRGWGGFASVLGWWGVEASISAAVRLGAFPEIITVPRTYIQMTHFMIDIFQCRDIQNAWLRAFGINSS